jgi:hypothetical protein
MRSFFTVALIMMFTILETPATASPMRSTTSRTTTNGQTTPVTTASLGGDSRICRNANKAMVTVDMLHGTKVECNRRTVYLSITEMGRLRAWQFVPAPGTQIVLKTVSSGTCTSGTSGTITCTRS